MEGKKSFVLYTDLIEITEELTDNEAGLLFKTILRYVNDLNPEVPKEIKLAFIPIKQDLKRDLKKYNAQVERINRINEERKRKKEAQSNNDIVTTSHEVEGVNDNVNVNVNDNVNVNVNDNVNVNVLSKDNVYNIVSKDTLSSKLNEACEEIINYLNLKTGKNYKSNAKATRDFIKARLNDKYTIDDFKHVIDIKCQQWLGTEQEKYLRPETLFRPSHFESYLNEKESKYDAGHYDVSNGLNEI